MARKKTETAPSAPELPAPESELLPLDKPRTIRLNIAGSPVDFTCARIPDAAWRKTLQAVIVRVEQQIIYPDGPEKPGVVQRTRVSDEDAALVQLFSFVLHVRGYAGTEGLGDSEIKARVPMRHRLAVCQVLRAVSATSAAEGTLSELVEIQLESPWTVGEDGGMRLFTGLVHRFRQPTMDQYRRWRQGIARTTTTGDASNGTTQYPSRLAVALGLYDEMIAEVEGYSIAGEVPTDIKAICAHMDGMHKARAVVELFERDEEDISIAGPQPAPPVVTDAVAEPAVQDAGADAAAA